MINNDLTSKPSWLELPDEEKQSHTYWVCYGKNINLDSVPKSDRWKFIYHSKEQAEAAACRKNDCWVWDGEPASSVYLKNVMFKARSGGHLGVKIRGYDNGEWKILKVYPVDVPLEEDKL